MARRGKVEGKPRHYVIRDRHGRFKKWTHMPTGIRIDSQWDAKKKLPKSKYGYGHRADYPVKPVQRDTKGFYTDKHGKVRPITGRKGSSVKALQKADENGEPLRRPARSP